MCVETHIYTHARTGPKAPRNAHTERYMSIHTCRLQWQCHLFKRFSTKFRGEPSNRSRKGRRDRPRKQCTLAHTHKTDTQTLAIWAKGYRRPRRWGCSHSGLWGVNRACGDSRVVGGSAGSRPCAAERNDSQLGLAGDSPRNSLVFYMRLVSC